MIYEIKMINLGSESDFKKGKTVQDLGLALRGSSYFKNSHSSDRVREHQDRLLPVPPVRRHEILDRLALLEVTFGKAF
jgi:hypothetical protein